MSCNLTGILYLNKTLNITENDFVFNNENAEPDKDRSLLGFKEIIHMLVTSSSHRVLDLVDLKACACQTWVMFFCLLTLPVLELDMEVLSMTMVLELSPLTFCSLLLSSMMSLSWSS